MDEKFNSILSVVLIPQVVALIVDKEKKDEINALNEFYQSKIYDLLSIEETKLWHYSPMTIYMIWKHERKTGKIVFPEE